MYFRRIKGAIVYSLLWAAAWAVAGVLLTFVQASASRADASLFGLVQFVPVMAAYWAMVGLVGGFLVACIVMFAERRHTVDQISTRRMATWGAVPGVLLPAANVVQLALRGRFAAHFLLGNIEMAVILGCVGAGLAVIQLKISKALPSGSGAPPHTRPQKRIRSGAERGSWRTRDLS